MKGFRSFTLGLLSIAAIAACLAVAGTSWANDRNQHGSPGPVDIPVLEEGTWATTQDNTGNNCTGAADNDMGTLAGANDCIFNTDARADIEFNINITPGSTKAGPYRLNIMAWDVDSPAENDEVWVNGVLVGTLVGIDNTWVLNAITVPTALLVKGNNCIQVKIDTPNPGLGLWCCAVRYGSLFAPQPNVPGISPIGLLAAALLLSAAGIWTVRRRRVYEA